MIHISSSTTRGSFQYRITTLNVSGGSDTYLGQIELLQSVLQANAHARADHGILQISFMNKDAVDNATTYSMLEQDRILVVKDGRYKETAPALARVEWKGRSRASLEKSVCVSVSTQPFALFILFQFNPGS